MPLLQDAIKVAIQNMTAASHDADKDALMTAYITAKRTLEKYPFMFSATCDKSMQWSVQGEEATWTSSVVAQRVCPCGNVVHAREPFMIACTSVFWIVMYQSCSQVRAADD